jgi:hypothetical protein
MIRRFSYFRDTIEEIRDPDANPKQAGLLKQRILSAKYYEEKWLLKRGGTGGANFASAARQKAKERR